MLTVSTATLREASDRIAYFLECPEITQWLSSNRSCTLIINGGEDQDEPESATSLFTAMLLRGLQGTGSGLVLMWFCGQHLLDPVQLMLRNLLSQLLEQVSASVELPEIDKYGRRNHVGDLVDLLRICIERQLRYRPIYIVLDAVSCYEDHQRARNLCRVFNRVASLTSAYRKQSQHPLKILLTSPISASDICACRAAVDAVVLDAPNDVDGAMREMDEVDVVQYAKASFRPRPVRTRTRPSTLD